MYACFFPVLKRKCFEPSPKKTS